MYPVGPCCEAAEAAGKGESQCRFEVGCDRPHLVSIGTIDEQSFEFHDYGEVKRAGGWIVHARSLLSFDLAKSSEGAVDSFDGTDLRR